MKVALVHHTFRLTGGTERYGVDLARALIAAGDEVHLVTHDQDGLGIEAASETGSQPGLEANGSAGAPDAISLEGAIVHRVAMARAGRTAKLLSFAWSSRRILRHVEASRGRFDMVLGLGRTLEQDVLRVGGGCHAAYLEAVEGWRNGRPPSPTALALYHRIALQIEAHQMALTRTRRVIAVSHRVKEELLRWYDLPGDAVRVIHNGVDLDRFDPGRFSREEARDALGLSRDALVVLFVGNGLERKGFFPLLEAFGRMATEARARGLKMPLRLLVAGRDALRHRPALERTELGWGGLNARIELAGEQARIERCYAAADMLALPTRYEPFGNVCLEAMATGLPVVTTVRNGAVELLEGEARALVLREAGDVEALTGALVTLLEEEARRRLGDANREVAQRHGVARNAREVRELLAEVAGESRESSRSTG